MCFVCDVRLNEGHVARGEGVGFEEPLRGVPVEEQALQCEAHQHQPN